MGDIYVPVTKSSSKPDMIATEIAESIPASEDASKVAMTITSSE